MSLASCFQRESLHLYGSNMRGLQDGLIWRLGEVTSNVGSVFRSGLRRVSLLLHSRWPLRVAAQLPTVLEQGSPISEPRTGTSSQPVRNWAAQEVNSRQTSEASSTASRYSHFCLNSPHPTHPTPGPWINYLP